MDSQTTQSSAADDPANAFEALRGEVSLLRRAVEGLTAERQNAPDYSPTLTELASRLSLAEVHLGKVAESPAMRLTPQNVAVSVARASETARAGDRDNLGKAEAALRTSIASINAVVAQAWTADRQLRQLCWGVGGGLVFGIIGTLSALHFIG